MPGSVLPDPLLLLLPPQAAAAPFAGDKALRDKKRSIDKFVTLNVQQISATLEQVGRWSGRGFLGRREGSGGTLGGGHVGAGARPSAQGRRCRLDAHSS